MINKYDLQKLQDLPIEQVAEAVGLEVRKHKSLCPFHSDSRPSLTFNVRKNRYRCYVCDARGGSIDLVMHHLNLSFRDACHWLAHVFSIFIEDEGVGSKVYGLGNFPKPRQITPARKFSNSQILDEKPDIPYLERLMAQPIINEYAAKFLFEERKIRMDVVRKLGLSSIAYNCPMSSSPKPSYFDGPALLIPYRDINGKLISVQSRYLGQEDKVRFKFPKGSQCHVFNIDCLKNLAPEEPIFITEGVTDCLAMLSAGFASIAIPSATLLKEEDIKILRGETPSSLNSQPTTFKFHMYPDADEPGNKLFLELKSLLETPSTLNSKPSTLTRHNLPAGFKDVGQYYSFIHKDDNSNL